MQSSTTGHEPPSELKEDIHGIENRFSPGPADRRNQAPLQHPERSTYRCFLTDLAGFTDICRAGPNCANRQDRKKTGLFHRLSSQEQRYFTPVDFVCQDRYLPISRLYFSFASAGILLRSVIIAVESAPGHSQVLALRSAGIFCATLRRMRWALATLALRLPTTISTVTDSSDSCQQS